MKKLIINCDDFGVSKETNNVIIQCLKFKKATSASILSNGDFFLHGIKKIKKNLKNNHFGVHLNLTEGKALSKSKKLTNKKNIFNHGPEYFFFLQCLKKYKKLENDIYFEFKSQILRVKEKGIKISHLDSHQHIHHIPFIFKIVKKLGKEFKIKKIRHIREKFILKNFFKNFLYKIQTQNYLKYFLIKIYEKKLEYFKSTNFFYGILSSGKININEFFNYVDSIDKNKTVELCIHPSKKTTKFKNLKFDEFYNSDNREYEDNLLFSSDFKKGLTKRKIKLINFSSV